MSWARRLLAAALAGCVLAAAAAAVARADGDPASDFLLSQDVFLPYGGGKIPVQRETAMTALVREANERGFRIKVALIATPSDLGAIGALWRQPQPYARFLGQELAFLYKGRLVIVMPNGYGVYHHGRPVAAERRVLDGLPLPEASGTDLASAATDAVRRLARTQGLRLAAPDTSAGGSSENRDRLVIVAVVLGIGAVAAVAFTVLRLRRRS